MNQPIVLLLTAACIATAAAQDGGVKPEAAAWIKRQAVPFTTAESGKGFTDLAPLKKIIGDARIVSLGEPTHGTREAFQMKHRMMEFLASEMGFTIFSIEANMPESYELNQYVLEGKGDPKKLIGGMYFWTWNTEEVLAMVDWMRDFNRAGTGRVQFTGFDMQTPTVAMKIVSDFVQSRAPDEAPAVTKAYDIVTRAKGGAGDFGVGTGSFPVEAARGKKVTFSGWIRTENIKDGWAGLWWRTDGPEGVLSFNNMTDQGPRGTTEWQRYEFTLDVPAAATNINFGVIMPGEGGAWFDDLEVRLDGEVYSDPARFSFDFENSDVKYLAGYARGYALKRSTERPHGGTTCLELRRLAEENAPSPEDGEAAALDVITILKKHNAALVAAAGAEETEWISQNARVVSQYAHMMNAKEPTDGSSLRDIAMAANVEWILRQNPDAKIVLWAHNAHVSRGPIWGQTWMGSHLEKKFPGQMVVFGFATGSGMYTAMQSGKGLSSTNLLQTPPANSVEAHLASAELPNLFLDIRGAGADDPATAWATTSRPMRHIGALAMDSQFSPVVAKSAFDVLIYQAQTTAAKQLDTKPGR